MAEWQQMFNETWRYERDYFYDPNMHGRDWQQVKARYAPLIPYIRHRSDLNYVLDQVTGELSVGHSFVSGGDFPAVDTSWKEIVEPIPSENALRQRAWVEDNRRKVDELSGGKLAYIWIPNTGDPGLVSFNRYFFKLRHAPLRMGTIDLQLERAVKEVLDLLKQQGPIKVVVPPYSKPAKH